MPPGQYGYPPSQGYAPPPKQGIPRVLKLVLIAVAIFVAIVAIAIVQSGSPQPAAAPTAAAEAPSMSDSLPDELSLADAISKAMSPCEQLERLGFAKNCSAQNANGHCLTQRDPDGTEHPSTSTSCVRMGVVRFDVVGAFQGDEGHVRCYRTDKDFKDAGDTEKDFDISPDDYPDLQVRSAKTRLLIDWGSAPGSDDAWDQCSPNMDAAAVAVCAKKYPAEYARLRALYEAAARVLGVDVPASSASAAASSASAVPASAPPPAASQPSSAPSEPPPAVPHNDNAPPTRGRPGSPRPTRGRRR